jgi:hypothetical protein
MHPVPVWAIDAKVGGGFAGSGDFRAHAGVRRHQHAILQVGLVVPDGRMEPLRPAWVHGVIDGVDPFHVRPKARLTCQIERQVNAETAGFRHWVNEARERRAAGQRNVAPLG